MPAHVPAAAMPAAGNVSDEAVVRTEWVAAAASARWVGDPLTGHRLHQLAEHATKLKHHHRPRAVCCHSQMAHDSCAAQDADDFDSALFGGRVRG